MDFSDEWRSLWPVSAIFSAPNLLSAASAAPFGPLLFSPSSPPIPLLSSRSLALSISPPLPPSSFLDGLRSFFRCPTNEGFLPSAAIDALAVDSASLSTVSGPADPIPSNNLVALRCRNGSSMILFFPTGENAHLVGYVGLSFCESTPEVRIDRKGDVFKQSEGFKHPYHRILKISVVSTALSSLASSWSSPEVGSASPSKPLIEGFLVAATLYSLNWFRVETRVSDSENERPFLVPLAKQGFESAVKHACWSPHLAEESAALLESGELCWFNLETKRGGMIRVTLGGDDPGEWLSCEFGGQPWTVIVACSKAIGLVDLRSTGGSGQRVLAKIEMLDTFYVAPLMEKNDKFLAFCKASFNDFYLSVVTEHQLHLLDMRNPLIPLLTWNHGLKCPQQIFMFRLSELRQSDQFQWASESGFALLVGSFWNNEFSLFFFGPKDTGSQGNSSLYSWELPCSLSLSSRQCSSGDSLVADIFSKKNFQGGSKWQQRKNIVAGFCMVPNDLLPTNTASPGFAIIRLTLSGKLEMQWYQASMQMNSQELNVKEENKTEYLLCCKQMESKVSSRYDFIELVYLYEHMKGNLVNALAMHNSQSNHKASCKVSLSHGSEELTRQLQDSNLSTSAFVNNVTIPSSIFEIACRRVLNSLQQNLVPLAFSKYSDLFQISWASTFEFLDVPAFEPHNKLLPFFNGKPSRRGEKWLNKASPGDNFVGPVLPISVLLTLQKDDKKACFSSFEEELDDNLLNQECKKVLQTVFPEISLAESGNCFAWNASEEIQDEKSYFVYEPAKFLSRSSCNSTSDVVTHEMKQEAPGLDQMIQTSFCPDENFSKFVCGMSEKSTYINGSHDSLGPNFFDLSPIRLDFDSSTIVTQPAEQKVLKCLKRQFSKWQENYKPYHDFCTSSKIPKLSN